jgi:hypothetical protein
MDEGGARGDTSLEASTCSTREKETQIKTLVINSGAVRVIALALATLTVGVSTAAAAPRDGVEPTRPVTVTTPYTLPNGAPITGTKLADGRVVIRTVDANGTSRSTVLPANSNVVAKKGFWGKVWGFIKKAYDWAKKHIRL